MENESYKNRILQKLNRVTATFNSLAITWLLLLVITSIAEVTLNSLTHGFTTNIFSVIGWSILNDIILWYKWLFVIFLLFAVTGFIHLKTARIIFYVFIGISVLAQFVLINYFNLSLLPLGADLFGYSAEDIKQTVGSSGGLNLRALLLFLLFAALTFAAIKWLSRRIRFPLYLTYLFLAFSLFFMLSGKLSSLPKNTFKDEFVNNLILNKTDFFFSSSYAYFNPSTAETDIYEDSYLQSFGGKEAVASSFKYVDPDNFPFLHLDSTADVLSPFFNHTADNTNPNIVIILVEGLGRAFTNDGAYLGNFTPFVDSLSNQSLYWPNFLSQGGRTFAVLPSLLGSLPFGKNGFLEMGEQMPQHLSLLNLLQANGYNTSFYYGGEAKFDNMNIYLRKNKVNELNDYQTFPAGYTRLPAQNGFSWGYNDKELFRYYLASRPVNATPQLNVILTVSTHSPFFVNDQDQYLQRFEKRMTELGFDDAKKTAYRDYKYQYASILFTDDALRKFFAQYKTRADYKNTIFLITGDHRMPEIPMSDKLDRYHVPLIVYSPMLKRTAKFASVSTHFDITPSLLAYLKKSYKIKTPAVATWVGQGLDTTRNFQNLHSYPLIQTKTDLIDFVDGEYHLNGEQVFKINADLSEELIQDEDKKTQLKNGFSRFLKRNSSVAAGAKIVPDSLIKAYTR